MDLVTIFRILIMACGVYMMYWAVQMNMSGKIPEMLVGKGFPISRAKDPKGFIKFTFPFTLATGIILFVCGGIGVLGILIQHPLLDSLMNLVVVAIVIAYGMVLMRAQKKYLVGIDGKNRKIEK